MKNFVTFDIAKKLKEKGFTCKYPFAMYDENEWFYPLFTSCDEENGVKSIFGNRLYYDYEDFIDADDAFIAPTISQVLEWLREEKKIFITVNIAYCYEDDENPFPTNLKMKPILKGYYYSIWDLNNLNDKNGHSKYFESPELAYLAGIEYVLENLI